MRTVVVADPRARIDARGGLLEVRLGDATLDEIRVGGVRELVLVGRIGLSVEARGLLLGAGVDVLFLGSDGRWLGRLTGAESRSADRRLRQYALVSDPGRRLAIARELVRGKVSSQRRMLHMRQRTLRDEAVGDALAALRAGLGRLAEVVDLDALRGHEGLAARWYFGAYGRAVTNPAFTFNERNRRPPRDPINALLSFGYAIVVGRVERAVRQAGLDPFLGVMHEAGRGAPACALDLAEEWRPVVDGVVLTLVNRRQLTPDDFREPGPDDLGPEAELAGDDGPPAVWLGPTARAILIRALEARLGETTAHPIRGDAWALGALFAEQAAQLARIVDAEQATFVPLEPWGES